MKLLLLFAIAALSFGQATLASLPDITGDSSAHALSGSVIHARYIDLTAPSANSGTCRTGDSAIGATRGQPIAPGGSYHYQALLAPQQGYLSSDYLYDLSRVYYFCQSGDKLSVLYAQ